MTLTWIIGVTLFLVFAAYIFYFKKFFSELAKQTVEMTTLVHRTKIVEDIKASLSRKNITYQIHQTEYAKLRFQRLDKLYQSLYELQKYCKTRLFNYSDDAGFRENKSGFNERYASAEDAYFLSLIYLDDAVAQSTLDLLNECFSALTAFVAYYYSDQNREVFRLLAPNQSLVNRNIASFDRFHESVGRFNELLTRIRDAVKGSLTQDNGAGN